MTDELDNLVKAAQETVEIQSEISKGQKNLKDWLDAAKETLQQLGLNFDMMASTLSKLLASVAASLTTPCPRGCLTCLPWSRLALGWSVSS